MKLELTTYSFEKYLEEKHMEQEPTVLDDDLPDAFDHWVCNIGYDLTIAYAEKWHTEQMLAHQLEDGVRRAKNAQQNSRLVQIY